MFVSDEHITLKYKYQLHFVVLLCSENLFYLLINCQEQSKIFRAPIHGLQVANCKATEGVDCSSVQFRVLMFLGAVDGSHRTTGYGRWYGGSEGLNCRRLQSGAVAFQSVCMSP